MTASRLLVMDVGRLATFSKHAPSDSTEYQLHHVPNESRMRLSQHRQARPARITRHTRHRSKSRYMRMTTRYMSTPVAGTITGDGELLMEEDNTQQEDGALTCSNKIPTKDDKTTLLQMQPGENTVTPAKDTTDTTKTQTGEDQQGQDNTITQHGQQKRGDDTGLGSEKDDNTPDKMDTGLIYHYGDKTTDDAKLSPKRTKKMKVDKSGEQPNERTRSMTRRAALIQGKT